MPALLLGLRELQGSGGPEELWRDAAHRDVVRAQEGAEGLKHEGAPRAAHRGQHHQAVVPGGEALHLRSAHGGKSAVMF